MNNVIWLSVKEGTPGRGYWDQFFLEQAFDEYNNTQKITDQKEAIVIIPGAYQGEYIEPINLELSRLKKCAVIITSDEENKFPVEKLKTNGKIYTTYPTFQMPDRVRWLPIGYPPQAKNTKVNFDKSIDWSFAGQVNHESRMQMLRGVDTIPNGKLEISKGFAQGLEYKEYYDLMSKSKVVLCPKGNISPDSFRLYEALENGCIPIVENSAFWQRMFGHIPFPVVDSGNQWRVYTEDSIRNYNTRIDNIYKWWQDKKQEIYDELRSL